MTIAGAGTAARRATGGTWPAPARSSERLAANLRRWLTPGIGVKRWLLLTFAGLLLLALGVAHVIRQVTRDLEPGGFARRDPRRRHAPVPAVPAARAARRDRRAAPCSASARTARSAP